VSEEESLTPELQPEWVLAVRLGHGANCSSIGSVVDTLFASAVVGGAVLAAVLAAMRKEPITVAGPPPRDPPDPTDEGPSSSEGGDPSARTKASLTGP
jgi:hypothetical protein